MTSSGTSLVVQWIRICLPKQGTWVPSLVWEDSTRCGGTNPRHDDYWAHTLEPVSCNYWGCVTQLLKPARLESMLSNDRGHHSEKPVRCDEEWPLLATTRESPFKAMETQNNVKKKKKNDMSCGLGRTWYFNWRYNQDTSRGKLFLRRKI